PGYWPSLVTHRRKETRKKEDKFMGGGAPEIPQRSFGEEWQGIKKGYKGQESQYLQFLNKDPFLQAAKPYALDQLKSFGGVLNQLMPTLQSLGRLSPEQIRDVTQSTLGPYAARQNATGQQAYAAQLLGRDQYRQSRFATALEQALQLGTRPLQNVLATERAGVQSYT